MEIPYFPGCTLRTKAKGFDNSARASMRALGIELVELADWNCCGATFPLSVDNLLALSGPARVLVSARAEGERLAVACSACYNVLKRTNRLFREDPESREKLNLFIEADYQGDLKVVHLLELLRDEIGFEEVGAAVKKPLEGLRVAPYYGCMLLRPPKEVAFDDPENPQVMDELLRSLGTEVVDFSHKVECCGSYLAIKSAEVTSEMSYAVLASAERNGAQALATSCPLCQFNLDYHQREMARRHTNFKPIPVFFFTQLLGLALGLGSVDYEFEKHYVDPRPLLKKGHLLPG